MKTQNEKFLCSNAWGCITDYRAHLAFELIRANGMIAGTMREDKSVSLLPPKEVVERAWALIDEWARIATERGQFGSAESLGVTQLESQRKPQ